MLCDGAWDPGAVEELERELGRSFNRGFTDAYLRGRSGAGLMSFERAINQGVRVGRLVAVGHEEVTVELDAAVAAGDTLEIRFYPGVDTRPDVPKRWPQVPCPVDAAAGKRVVVHCKRKVDAGCEVYLIRSAGVLDQTAAVLERMRAEADAIAPVARAVEVLPFEGRCGGWWCVDGVGGVRGSRSHGFCLAADGCRPARRTRFVRRRCGA